MRGRCPRPSAGATASAFSSPLTRNHTAPGRGSGRRRSGVIRSGGGLGESVTADARSRRRRRAAGWPGNSDATWPSGPTPSITTSNSPAPCVAQRRRRTPPRRPRRSRRVVGRRHRVHLAGSSADLRRGAPRGPGRRCGRRSPAATNRSSPHQTTTRAQSTSEPRPRAGPARGARRRRCVPPVSAICGTSPGGLGVGEPVEQLAGDRGGQRVRRPSCTSIRRRRSSSAPLFASRRADRGVDVVLVEPAQLLGQQLAAPRGA